MPLTATRELAVTCLPGRKPVHARHARQQARNVLAAWGLGEHADLGQLIVSELVTNAVCHGDGPIEMRLSFADGDLRVEVHDNGAGLYLLVARGDAQEIVAFLTEGRPKGLNPPRALSQSRR